MSVNLPIIMSGSVAVAANATSPIPVDTARIVNTYRVPIEVREIRFNVVSRAIRFPTSIPLAAAGMHGVLVDLRVGRHKITRDFLPLAALRSPATAIAPDDTMAYLDPGGGFDSSGNGEVRWALDSPFILPPGTGFSCLFRSRALRGVGLPPTDMPVVSIVIVGRAMPGSNAAGRPQKIPYATGYMPNDVAGGNGLSPQGAFENIHPVPLNVYRFIGTAAVFEVPGTVWELQADNAAAVITDRQFPVTVRGPVGEAGTTQRRTIVGPMEWTNLFSQRGYWPARTVLDPKEWFQFDVDVPAGRTIYPTVAMIGDRDEVL